MNDLDWFDYFDLNKDKLSDLFKEFAFIDQSWQIDHYRKWRRRSPIKHELSKLWFLIPGEIAGDNNHPGLKELKNLLVYEN